MDVGTLEALRCPFDGAELVPDADSLRCLECGRTFPVESGVPLLFHDDLPDPKIGLGRGAFYGEFPRVQADGEHLPFAEESFDVVYCVATLHHALDLPRMVREMARVARRGAIVAGLNEGTRGVLAKGE